MNEKRLKSLRKLSTALDSAITLPGGFKVGADGVLGLIPGYGDALGALLSGYIIVQAARIGVPKAVLARMGVNVGVEAVVGMIPILGDLFDFVWKANDKNMALIEASVRDETLTKRKSAVVVALVAVGVAILLAILLVLAVWLMGALWTAAFGA